MTAEAYPLQWPDGVPRTQRRQEAAFGNHGFGRVRDDLLAELRRMGAQHIVLSTNVQLRLDGLPYATFRNPDDPGVAVYFLRKGQQLSMACDRWRKIEHNLRALTLTVAALRGLDRWGSSDLVNRAFAGFAALPPSSADWRSVFGMGSQPLTLSAVRARYRELAMNAHPDRGGSDAQMARLNEAMAAAEESLS